MRDLAEALDGVRTVFIAMGSIGMEGVLQRENDYTTDTFKQITGRSPRPVAEFLSEYRAQFI